MKRLSRILTTFVMTILLAAFSQSAAGSSSVDTQHPAVETYLKIRSHLANGDIAAAAQFSDDPAAFTQQYTRAMERRGQAAFQARMQRTLTEVEFHSLRDAGDYSMLLLKLPANRYSPVAAVFFKRNGANQYLELTKTDLDIPCPLLDHFYTAKGEPEAQYVCKG